MGRRFLREFYIKYTCFAKNNESLERKTGKTETAICADTKEDGSRLIVYNIRPYLGNIFIFLKKRRGKGVCCRLQYRRVDSLPKPIEYEESVRQ